MANVNLTSTSGSGFLETDFDQIKEALQDATKDINCAELQCTTLDIGGTNITATGTELNYVDGVTSAIQTQLDSKFEDVMTTRGDILYRDATNTTARLGVGTNGQVLTSDGTDVSWEDASGGITGPGSSTDNAVVRWNGTTGSVAQSSDMIIDDNEQITGVNTLTISQTATSGNGLSITRDLAAASTDAVLVSIVNDNAGDDQNAITIQNDGTGYGMFIDQNGDNTAFEIDSEATTGGATGAAFKVYADQGCSPALIATDANDLYRKSFQTTGVGSHYFYRNLDSGTTAAPVILVDQTNAGDDQPAIRISQDAAVESIHFSNGTIAFDFATAMVSTGAGTMAVNNSPGSGATTWVKVEVNGTTGYIPVHYAS